MGGKSDSRAWKRPIDAAARATFLAALRAGAPRRQAAAAGGYALNSFYRAARRDSQFRAAWDAIYADTETGHAMGEERIASGNRRIIQRRRMGHVKFDEARQQRFLAHFAWSCDVMAAAAEAGVSESTVYVHRRKDSVFAAEFQEALEQGYVRLEAEALRQRLAAQQRLRAAIEGAGPAGDAAVTAEMAAEFERVMKLLARWDRRGGSPGPREVRHGRRQRMSFDEAIVLLEKKLEAFGYSVDPPEEEGGA